MVRMVRVAGSDIPNLSDIVNETFDSLGEIYGGDSVEFDGVDTDIDISMNDNFDDYVPDMVDVSNSIDDSA